MPSGGAVWLEGGVPGGTGTIGVAGGASEGLVGAGGGSY